MQACINKIGNSLWITAITEKQRLVQQIIWQFTSYKYISHEQDHKSEVWKRRDIVVSLTLASCMATNVMSLPQLAISKKLFQLIVITVSVIIRLMFSVLQRSGHLSQTWVNLNIFFKTYFIAVCLCRYSLLFSMISYSFCALVFFQYLLVSLVFLT